MGKMHMGVFTRPKHYQNPPNKKIEIEKQTKFDFQQYNNQKHYDKNYSDFEYQNQDDECFQNYEDQFRPYFKDYEKDENQNRQDSQEKEEYANQNLSHLKNYNESYQQNKYQNNGLKDQKQLEEDEEFWSEIFEQNEKEKQNKKKQLDK
ncbi:hypothetical protein PPERSA_02012 [Pseudocohnilembus persalinus]|uniref:Uncharacterized protein n=1 Tax=Pseudocohnilembus persalinus TaxID=266149 RepID=A0A0V0QF49_PSEPJ|nr:hypothetical protein PPERSA_02012 [Pseudocohnilembus persalinus]|eukprot:KRX00833.1 hypothetical protein PPERSA_02012 [Pseudocohnilembus persalinus]